MRILRRFTSRLPLTALLLPLLLFVSSCSAYKNNGSTLTIAGFVYLILGIAALISLFKQDWDLTKKLIWGAVIWFLPVPGLGPIIYFLFSGRK